MSYHRPTEHDRAPACVRFKFENDEGPGGYSNPGGELLPEILGESWRLRKWLQKRHLTLLEAAERDEELSGLQYLSVARLAAAAALRTRGG